MGLFAQAQADIAAILADDTAGFAVSALLKSPTDVTSTIKGYFTHVTQVQDPNTGELINGSKASFVTSNSAVVSAALGKPFAEPRASRNPWTLQVTDAMGSLRNFKVRDVLPDRTVGCYVMELEFFVP